MQGHMRAASIFVCVPLFVSSVCMCVYYTWALHQPFATLAQHTTATVVAGYTASNSDALRCSGTSCACLVWLVGRVCQCVLFACCCRACLCVSTPRCWLAHVLAQVLLACM